MNTVQCKTCLQMHKKNIIPFPSSCSNKVCTFWEHGNIFDTKYSTHNTHWSQCGSGQCSHIIPVFWLPGPRHLQTQRLEWREQQWSSGSMTDSGSTKQSTINGAVFSWSVTRVVMVQGATPATPGTVVLTSSCLQSSWHTEPDQWSPWLLSHHSFRILLLLCSKTRNQTQIPKSLPVKSQSNILRGESLKIPQTNT